MYIGMMLLHNSEIIIDMQNNPKISQPKLTLLSTLTTILYYNYIASNCKQSNFFFIVINSTECIHRAISANGIIACPIPNSLNKICS